MHSQESYCPVSFHLICPLPDQTVHVTTCDGWRHSQQPHRSTLQSASEISCQLPRQRQDPRTRSRARTRPGAGRSRLIDSPRRHERGGGGRETQGGDPEAGPAAARWLLQGTPFGLSCLTFPSGAAADLSHPRRRVSFFLCSAAISRMARARIPPLLSMLRAMRSMICADQSSAVNSLRWPSRVEPWGGCCRLGGL